MFACVYINNILITGTSEEKDLNLSEVLIRIENTDICLKKDKILSEVQYLGHKGLEPSEGSQSDQRNPHTQKCDTTKIISWSSKLLL